MKPHGFVHRVVAVCLGVVLLTGVFVVGSFAGHQTSVASYTGCLKVSQGTLSRFAVGNSPYSPCPADNVVVHVSGGDITAVNAGTGLTGTAAQGAANLSVNFADFGTCPAGSAIRVIDTTATCETDDNTTYSAGAGLDLTGATFSVDFADFGTCPAGSAIRVIGTTATCETDDDTTYSAGAGLALTGTTFSADTSAIQARVSDTCAVDHAIREVNADGTVVCESIPSGGSGGGELILIQRDEFDTSENFWNGHAVDWDVVVTGGADLLLDPQQSAYITSAVTMETAGSDPGSVVVRGKRQASLSDGTLVFKARVLDAYAEESGGVYGDRQPRGLANGGDRSNAIEFVNAGGPGATLVACRTVSGGAVTENVADIGQWVRSPAVYQIVASSTEVKFYVNGVLECTHTTNIPTTPLNLYFSTSDGGAGNVPHMVDWTSFERRVP